MPKGRATTINLTAAERQELEQLHQGGGAESPLALRARIVLLAAEGLKNVDIAERVQLHHRTVGRWRELYAAEGRRGLSDQCRHTPADQVPDVFFAGANGRLRRRPAPGNDQYRPLRQAGR
jgi:hypothetical protein